MHQSTYYTVRYLIILRFYELFIQSRAQFSDSRSYLTTAIFSFGKVVEPAGSVSFFLVRRKCFD